MRATPKSGFFFGASAIPLMFSGIFGAELFGFSPPVKAGIFAASLGLGLVLIIYGAIAELKDEAANSCSSGRAVRMVSVYGMLISSLCFVGFAAAYLWPTPKVAPEPLNQELTQADGIQEGARHLPVLTAQAEPQPPILIQPSEPPLSQTNPFLFEILDDSEEKREFTDKTLDYFNDLKKRENPVQIEALIKPYIGMLIRYTGVLDGLNIIPTDQGYISVALNYNGNVINGGMVLFCRYPDKFRSYIARFNSNQQISGVGTIAKLGSLGLELNGCHPTSPKSPHVPFLESPQPPERK